VQLLDVETTEWALKTYDLELRRYKGGDALVAVEGKDQVQPHLDLAAMRVSPASPRVPQVQSSVLTACLPGIVNKSLSTWHTAGLLNAKTQWVRSVTLRRTRRGWWFDSTGAAVSSPRRFWARRMRTSLASRVKT
jgi:hypothetical protein